MMPRIRQADAAQPETMCVPVRRGPAPQKGCIVNNGCPCFLRCFGDVAHLGHVELLYAVVGRGAWRSSRCRRSSRSGRRGDSVVLRAWGEYQRHSLKLTAHETSGLGDVGLRVRDEGSLRQSSRHLAAHRLRGRGSTTRATGRRFGARHRMGMRSRRTVKRYGSLLRGDGRLQESASSATCHGASRRGGSTISTLGARRSAMREFFHDRSDCA